MNAAEARRLTWRNSKRRSRLRNDSLREDAALAQVAAAHGLDDDQAFWLFLAYRGLSDGDCGLLSLLDLGWAA